ncbi:MAG: dihydropteroate synthase [Candidatus Omnitrophica bacterium]|nr:dihydropteroate synthase [Candidatus Omnitrophota bacterium]
MNYTKTAHIWRLTDRVLDVSKKVLIMGVLNVTPDSFSDGGKYQGREEAVKRALEMVEEGADIIDIGGESTRPGACAVSAAEELERTIPVVSELSHAVSVPISIDTTKAVVARQAIEHGAHIVNDVSGLVRDPGMLEVVKESACGCIVMHMRGTPQTMQEEAVYGDVVSDVIYELTERLQAAQKAGISPESLAIDPGIGFAKRLKHTAILLNRLDEFHVFGRPVVTGLSRKSFIGEILGLEVDQRIFGTAAAISFAVIKGARIVRVHDVSQMRQVVRVLEVLQRGGDG